MSPFFKRNRKADRSVEASDVKPSAPSPARPDDAAHAETESDTPIAPLDDIPRDGKGAADDFEGSSGKTREPGASRVTDSLSRTAKLSIAYAMWHKELMSVAEGSSHPADVDDPATIDLSFPHPTGASHLYSGRPTPLTSLVREESAQREARARLAGLRARIDSLAERYGYAPVTLAIGQMTWTESPAGHTIRYGGHDSAPDPSDPRSPSPGGDAESDGHCETRQARDRREIREAALLRSARLEPAGSDDAHITLTARCEVNPAVLRALRNHGTPSEQIAELRALAADVAREDEAIARLRETARAHLPGFDFADAALLGSFVHPGHVLLGDLEAMKPYIENSGIMAALAGDEETRRLSAAPLPPAETRDRAPEAERGAGDRDPAELAVIEAIASGRSIAVDTPPGSEAVGTLASIVADSAASGRSVLYIPGRASAARALVDEMERLGLGELVLDFSDLDGVAHRLRTGMRLRSDEAEEADVLELRASLTRVRREFSEYVASLHEIDPRWGESVFTLLEHLALLTAREDAPKSRVRLDSDALEDLDGNVEEIRGLLEEAADLGAFAPSEDSPWKGAVIRTRAEGDEVLMQARRLASETLPVVMAQAQRATGETGLTPPETLGDWREQISMLEGISHSLDIFLPQIFERSAHDMVVATASKEWREGRGEEMKGSERRRLTKQARDFLRPGATSADLHTDLKTVQRQREVWRRYCKEGGWPKLPDGMAQIRASAEEAARQLEALESVLPGRLTHLEFAVLLERVRALAGDETTMARLPRANEVVSILRERGYGTVLDDFAARNVTSRDVAAELELVRASSVFEQLVGRSPVLARTTPAGLDDLAEQVRRLDGEHTATLAPPVARSVVRIMRETISKNRDETMKLDAQLERYSTSILRDAIAAHPRLVQAARPVWVIPSMITAEFVPPMPWADVVVMDELDSTNLASAVSLLMRGRQIVVMGNLRRARCDDAGAAIVEFANVLPVCELPTLRARHDELATQTLREQGYGDVLRMVPSVKRARRPRLNVVNGRGVPNPQSGMVEGPQAEVEAVVDAVVDHALTRPEQSLAVVSVSTAHAARVRDIVVRLAATSPQLAAFLRQTGEPFAVVELTQAAGLRRDSVILTVGLGKTVHGRVLHTFGPLSTPMGLAGMVDAIEAAREDLTIVTSLGPGEIGSKRLSTPGPRLLERLIDRAAGREVVLEPDESGRDLGPLLGDLAARLRRSGWLVAMDFGFDDGMRIPLVAGHPTLPGTWRVAVLTDDETYVGEPSLRRRDRYWIELLQARGWTVVRTFSTSLFIDPVGQAENVIAALQAVCRAESVAPVEVPMLDDEWVTPSPEPVTVGERDDAPQADAAASGAPAGESADSDRSRVGDEVSQDAVSAVSGASAESGGTAGDGGAASADDAGEGRVRDETAVDAGGDPGGSGRAGANGEASSGSSTSEVSDAGPGLSVGSARSDVGSDRGSRDVVDEGAVGEEAGAREGDERNGAETGRRSRTSEEGSVATRGNRSRRRKSARRRAQAAAREAGDAEAISQRGRGLSGKHGSHAPVPDMRGLEWLVYDSAGPGGSGDAQRDADGDDPIAHPGGSRGRRPDVRAGRPLAAYTDDQLDRMVAWIAADGVPRTEDEFVAAMREELAIRRRGAQIDTVLRNVVVRSGLAVEPDAERDGEDAVDGYGRRGW